MSIDVRAEIVVQRPREVVAAYMFDPAHDAEWTTGVIECRPRQPGRLVRGARVERVTRFLGRRFGYEYEVLDTDGERFVEMRVTEPFPMQIRYQLDEVDGGTRTSIRASGDATGFFRMAAPVMAPMVRRNIANDLALLKAKLES